MFLALAHMVGATQVMGLGWGGVGMITFLALAHMVGATQVMGLGWGGGDDNVPWTCTHGRCYASHGMGWGGVGMITFLELAHMVGATQVMGWGGVGVGWGGDDNVPWTCTHGRCYDTSCSLHLHTWSVLLKKQRQQKTDTKGLTVRHCNFFHVQIHCACQWIMTLPPKILWPTALLNTWNIITFPKSSFYHTNHTFLTNINVWMMDFWSINTRIKKFRPRRTQFYVENDFFKNSRFATAK